MKIAFNTLHHFIMSSSNFIATLAAPEPRDGSVEGLNYFVRRTLASLGLVVTNFHTPTYQECDGPHGSFRLVHIKFDFELETGQFDTHRREFRLSDDELAVRTRESHASTIMGRLNEYADAEAAYFAIDKESRGNFKTAVTVKPLEIVHTPASDRGPEKFWKVKIVRPVRPRTGAQRADSAPMFR